MSTFSFLLLIGAEFFALLILIIYTGVITVLALFLSLLHPLGPIKVPSTMSLSQFLLKFFWNKYVLLLSVLASAFACVYLEASVDMVARLMAVYFSFLALWGIENELKSTYVDKYKSVPQFLPARDLKLFFQTEKYTCVKFCPYWGVANFFLAWAVPIVLTLCLAHPAMSLRGCTLSFIFIYSLHLLIFLWNSRIEYTIRYTHEEPSVNAWNRYYIYFFGPYLLNAPFLCVLAAMPVNPGRFLVPPVDGDGVFETRAPSSPNCNEAKTHCMCGQNLAEYNRQKLEAVRQYHTEALSRPSHGGLEHKVQPAQTVTTVAVEAKAVVVAPMDARSTLPVAGSSGFSHLFSHVDPSSSVSTTPTPRSSGDASGFNTPFRALAGSRWELMAIAEAIEDDLKNEALPVATQPQIVGSVNVAPSSFIRVHQSAGLSNSVSSNEIAQPAQPISTVGASAGAAAQQISPSKVTVPQIDEVRGAAGTETAAAALLRSSSMLQDFGLFVECEELDIKTEGEDDKFAVILPLESPVKSKIMFLDLEKSLKTWKKEVDALDVQLLSLIKKNQISPSDTLKFVQIQNNSKKLLAALDIIWSNSRSQFGDKP